MTLNIMKLDFFPHTPCIHYKVEGTMHNESPYSSLIIHWMHENYTEVNNHKQETVGYIFLSSLQ